MLTSILQNIGLTQKEAKIYLAALEVGSSPVSKIAAKAKINRVTTYSIIEKLISKGMFNFMTRNKIKFYTATDPEILVNEYKRRSNDLLKVLPDLKRLHGDSSHPQIRYFEGLDGIKAIYADTLNSKTEILNYCNSKEIRNLWPGYDEEYVKERVKHRIHLRGIAPDDEYGFKVKNLDPESNREIRLIAKEQYNFTNEINIYGNKVAIVSFKDELIGMIIESHEIANTQRAIFNMVWDFSGLMSTTMTVRKIGNLKKGSDTQQPVAVKKPTNDRKTDQTQLF